MNDRGSYLTVIRRTSSEAGNTDVGQLAATVRMIAEEYWSEGLPPGRDGQLDLIARYAEVMERVIQDIIDAMCEDLMTKEPDTRRS